MAEREPTYYFQFARRSLGYLYLTAGLSHADLTASERRLIHRIEKQWEEVGILPEVGRGGDMVAYSHPDLDFVVKFPYDDSSMGIVRRWPEHIRHGFSLGKENLGGILAPSIDLPLFFRGERGPENVLTAIILQ